MLIINADIITMDGDIRYKNGYIHIKNGKIFDIGPMQQVPNLQGEEVMDANGAVAIPGLIDAHCHLGIFGDSLGAQGDDANEESSPCTPHIRAIDGINPMDGYFKEAVAAGITTVVTGPGSANVIGGQMAAIKTHGVRIDNMIVKAPCAIKCSFGENPKTVYRAKDEAPATRMAAAAMLRSALLEAKIYGKKKQEQAEDFCEDLKNEALLMVLNREIPIHAHAHRSDDIFTAIRIAKEFGIDLKIIHCSEGHLIAHELAKENIEVMVGPYLTDRSKPELKNLSLETAAAMEKAGIKTALVTDHPETPINYLLLCAQMAVKNGMSPKAALCSITFNAARIAGIGNTVGKLSKGYDADIVIFNKNPLDFDSKVLYTFINGAKVHKKEGQ
jgi:imidazolonepropionase-like amidohydrolase